MGGGYSKADDHSQKAVKNNVIYFNMNRVPADAWATFRTEYEDFGIDISVPDENAIYTNAIFPFGWTYAYANNNKTIIYYNENHEAKIRINNYVSSTIETEFLTKTQSNKIKEKHDEKIEFNQKIINYLNTFVELKDTKEEDYVVMQVINGEHIWKQIYDDNKYIYTTKPKESFNKYILVGWYTDEDEAATVTTYLSDMFENYKFVYADKKDLDIYEKSALCKMNAKKFTDYLVSL